MATTPASVLSLPPEHLSELVKQLVVEKLDAAATLRLLKLRALGSNPLDLDTKDSLLLEFPNTQTTSAYRMLVCFRSLDLLAIEVQEKIRRALYLLDASIGVFWVTRPFQSIQIQSLKGRSIDPLYVPLEDASRERVHRIPDFVHLPDLQYEASLHLNLLCNEIVKRLRKKFHLVLSEVAANDYDKYGTFATKAVMQFEDQILLDTLKELLGDHARGGIAIDVGCGDGRHSRPLARRFETVVAFDLSRAMTDAAKKKDAEKGEAVYRKIQYYENDFEYEEFPEEKEFSGKVDFICASFGMPSFVEDTIGMLRRFHKWLRPQGMVLLTFYNSESLALNLPTPWADHSLSARLDLERDALEVELGAGIKFSIFCRPFDSRTLEMIKGTFEVEHVHYYPHMMSVLPPAVFGGDDAPNFLAREFFVEIDKEVTLSGKFKRSHYVFVVAKKSEHYKQGYLNVIAFLKSKHVDYHVESHSSVVSTREVQGVLGLSPKEMVKTVIFTTSRSEHVAAILQADRQVDTGKLARVAELHSGELFLTSPPEVSRICGFPIGGIAPFGLPLEVRVIFDKGLEQFGGDYIYSGCGDNTKTLRLSREDFLMLAKDHTFADITALT